MYGRRRMAIFMFARTRQTDACCGSSRQTNVQGPRTGPAGCAEHDLNISWENRGASILDGIFARRVSVHICGLAAVVLGLVGLVWEISRRCGNLSRMALPDGPPWRMPWPSPPCWRAWQSNGSAPLDAALWCLPCFTVWGSYSFTFLVSSRTHPCSSLGTESPNNWRSRQGDWSLYLLKTTSILFPSKSST